METNKSKNKIMLIHPPGNLFQRGEDRCQINLEATVAQSLHACNDIGYAASALLKTGYQVKLKDYQGENLSETILFNDLKEFNPDILIISITDATILQDLELVKKIKSEFELKIVLKGAIFWNYNEKYINKINFTSVDFLIGAELEFSIVKLADYILNSIGDIKEVPNTFYKNNDGTFIPTNFGVREQNLDNIEFPARELMNNNIYIRPDTGEAMATIQTSRGCTGNCIYCLVPPLSGDNVRFRSPENVFMELQECYDKYGIKNFFFRSDSFTIDEVWVSELCKLIISSNLWKKIEFTANSRVFPLKKETLAIMKEAGCFLVAFGFESGSNDTMKKICKGATIEHNRQAMKWAREVGLQVFGMFVVGFPWETKEHIDQTKKFIHEIKPDFIEVNLALPFSGTKLFEMCQKDEHLEKNVLSMDFFNPKVPINPNFSCDELIKLRSNILLSYYLTPNYIFRKLKYVLLKKDCKILLNYLKYGINMIKKLLLKKHKKKNK